MDFKTYNLNFDFHSYMIFSIDTHNSMVGMVRSSFFTRDAAGSSLHIDIFYIWKGRAYNVIERGMMTRDRLQLLATVSNWPNWKKKVTHNDNLVKTTCSDDKLVNKNYAIMISW